VPQDWSDHHVERWLPLIPDLDPDVEGAVTRMWRIMGYLKRRRMQYLQEVQLHNHEFETIHVLAGRHGAAVASELASDLNIAPASVTGRIDGLERRGYVRRVPSPTDRRRVDISLTEAGWSAWREAMDALGDVETRIFDVLTASERKRLSDALRKIALAAEGEG
jgi:DNA-binding MarR family transcriptional regulator